MNWALIANIAQMLTYYSRIVGDWVTEEVPIGTIINLIVYDGGTDYTPPEGTKLEQVPLTANIGDTGY